MLKKILVILSAMFCADLCAVKHWYVMEDNFSYQSVNHNRAAHQSNAGGWVATAAVASVAIGTGVYWSVREPNDVKMARVDELLKYYSSNLHYALINIKTLDDMRNFVGQSNRFKKETEVFIEMVNRSYAEMSARYNSWVKPWNWNVKMKAAFEKIQDLRKTMRMVEMMITYYPFMVMYSYPFDEKILVQRVQMICLGKSAYPMCSCATSIQQDLLFLKTHHFKVWSEVVLIDMLEQLLSLILSSSTYIEEKRIQEEMAIKARQAEALERQSRAAEHQVGAQYAQAQAQREQAKAQEERNRIEREKLDRDRW